MGFNSGFKGLIIVVVTDSDKTIRGFTFTHQLVYIYVVALYGCEA